MSAVPAPDAIKEAADLLAQSQPPEQVLARLSGIDEGHLNFAQAQHLRAICAMRGGDAHRAKDLLIDAIRRGEGRSQALLNLGRISALAGMPRDALAVLHASLKGAPADQLQAFLPQLIQALGFADSEARADKDAVFELLLLPLLETALARRAMDNALLLESIIYNYYVKATETEAHFGRCMEKIAPLFSEAGRYWREALPIAAQPSLNPPYRVGFFIHNASTLAHIQILLTALRAYRTLDEQHFEPIVYCLSGQSPEMEQMLAAAGVRLVMLKQRFPEARHSPWHLLVKLRQTLAEEGVQELVWISLVTMLPLAFSMRMAPVQVWWCMKYHNFSHEEIDGYVCTRQTSGYGMLAGRQWRMAMLGSDEWFDPGRSERAMAIRASLGARTVLFTLGRTEKMQDPIFLSAVVRLLQAHPDAMFVWAGREESRSVVATFKAGGVFDRTRFIGWVDTLLWAQVGDVFIDSFPFPCGITLVQAMAAGKPVVLYDSPEAAQTGVWNIIKPRIEGDEGSPQERAQLAQIIGDRAHPNIAVARTPKEYVAYVSRLIRDEGARAAAGDASRRFVSRYFSDTRGMAASLARHFVEMIEERRAAG